MNAFVKIAQICRIKVSSSSYQLDIDTDYKDFTLNVGFYTPLDLFLCGLNSDRLIVVHDKQLVSLVNPDSREVFYFERYDLDMHTLNELNMLRVKKDFIRKLIKRIDGYALVFDNYILEVKNNSLIDKFIKNHFSEHIDFVLLNNRPVAIYYDNKYVLLWDNYYDDGKYIEPKSNINDALRVLKISENEFNERVSELLNSLNNPIKVLKERKK